MTTLLQLGVTPVSTKAGYPVAGGGGGGGGGGGAAAIYELYKYVPL